jgi:hypothetical protein
MTVMKLKTHRDDLAENLNELILTMELADFNDDLPDWWTEKIREFQFQPLRFLQEVEPIDTPELLPIADGSTEEIFDPRELVVTPGDLPNPLDVTTVIPWSEPPDGEPGTWLFERYRSVPAPRGGLDFRPGATGLQPPNPALVLIEHTIVKALVDSDITYESCREFLCLRERGQWWPLRVFDADTGDWIKSEAAPGMVEWQFLEPDLTHPEAAGYFDAIDYSTKLALARQFARFYQWRVLFRDHPRGTATLSLVTDPRGALAAFKLRDKPAGAKRRPALKHWVRKHWRQTRGGDCTALVRAHLRGETNFIFEGMECQILPSPADIEKVTKPK